MSKANIIENSFYCDLCKQLLVDPVIMPCGKFICKTHLDNLLLLNKKMNVNQSTFICGICQERHLIPNNGFVVNNRIQELLDIHSNKVESNPVFKECEKEIELAKEAMLCAEQLETNSEIYIYNFFEVIKRKVNQRRKSLKLKVDNYSDYVIKLIEISQLYQIKLPKRVTEITKDIDKCKKKLKGYMFQFETVEYSDKKFGEIKARVADLNTEFHELIVEFQVKLIGNKKYTFEFDEISMVDIFGRLTDCEANCDSIILDKEKRFAFYQICKFPLISQCKLLYRASRDGFATQDFHSKCDGFSNTLTIIKSTSGNIFGGFVEKAWDSSSEWVTDPKAYIFSLINLDNRPFKAFCSNNGENAIYCGSTYGPTFGGGHDICIESNSHMNQSSHCNFGYTFVHADYDKDAESSKAILAGSKYFQTFEIEVLTFDGRLSDFYEVKF